MEDSDDEFELVHCEEILVTEEDADDSDSSPLVECKLELDDDEEEDDSGAASVEYVSVVESADDDGPRKPLVIDPLRDKAALKYVRRPTRPVRLFSYTDRDLQQKPKPSAKDEATKSLAMQLLEIVKSVNCRRQVKVENGAIVPNFYIMATKCESQPQQKITEMDSKGIVSLVKDVVHMIKIGIYRQVDYVDIICDSPAIFLIKHLKVKHWDASMNAVYVVTSEYLMPYVRKIRAAEEEERRIEKRIARKGRAASSSSTSNAGRAGAVDKRKKCKNSGGGSSSTSSSSSNNRSSGSGSLPAVKSASKPSKKVRLRTCKQKPTSDGDAAAALPTTAADAVAGSNPGTAKTDEEIVEAILSKYLEDEAVQFFVCQMKVAGKTHNQYRWKEEDKLFALNLLRKAPTEYSILFQKFLLPSDKTLEKFLSKLEGSKGISSEDVE